MPLGKVVSGGQTGVDRAALDVALALGLPCGGWCPRHRQAEDGSLPSRYPLTETPSTDPRQRTEWNVRDSDGTLILLRGKPAGGTALTLAVARRLGKPCLRIQLDAQPDPERVCAWVQAHGIRVLNLAGPRESQCPGIQAEATAFLRRALPAALGAPKPAPNAGP